MVFNKGGVPSANASPPSLQAAQAANSKNLADSTSTPVGESASVTTRQPNRTVRDTTSPGPNGGGGSASARAHSKRVVDFDITSPELTIMDDYLGEPFKHLTEFYKENI